ncbi:MAG: VOC family protein [Solirubrobacteraceae bacterium]
MSRRDAYPPGVPCFVDTLTTDLVRAQRFYSGVFGWDFVGMRSIPDEQPGAYYVARIDGADVAGLGIPVDAGAPTQTWNTYVAVTSADETAEAAREAGGSVIIAPVDAAPAGRMGVLGDPSGAAFCIWEPAERLGAARVNEPSAWAMSALSTDDPEAAAEFYGRLFGWRSEAFGPEGSGMWLCRLPGFVGGEPEQPVPRDVVAAIMAGEAPARWNVDFWIDEADRAAAAAADLGGSVLGAPFEDSGFRRAVLADPDGAPFTVSQKLST